jgi:hypothetical protein
MILGKCLDAFGQGTANGTRIVLYTCNGQANQQWQFQANGTVRGVQSGRCLTPLNGATANGTGIVLADCGTATYQRWTMS